MRIACTADPGISVVGRRQLQIEPRQPCAPCIWLALHNFAVDWAGLLPLARRTRSATSSDLHLKTAGPAIRTLFWPAPTATDSARNPGLSATESAFSGANLHFTVTCQHDLQLTKLVALSCLDLNPPLCRYLLIRQEGSASIPERGAGIEEPEIWRPERLVSLLWKSACH